MIISGTQQETSATKLALSLAPRSTVATPQSAVATAKADAAGASTSADDSNPITANDFLTLLVTEMKNQDPTQPTDPNAYIQQLVGVNSLQQLISINQELGSVTSQASSASATPVTAASVATTPSVDSL
jgi:flagellar basal-body rod modification protein FlgD